MNTADFSQGLIPAIVQDAGSGTVLMLAYMNDEALRLTEETGWVHFWSRSRDELWKKGATSGNTLAVESITLDCDGDTVLVRAHPAGPVCHTGTESCFGPVPPTPADVLAQLEATIADRTANRPEGSYTARLVELGPEGAGRKLVEEATEVLLAAKDHAAQQADGGRVAEESADLLYHLLVMLAERGLSLRDVTAVLAQRSG